MNDDLERNPTTFYTRVADEKVRWDYGCNENYATCAGKAYKPGNLLKVHSERLVLFWKKRLNPSHSERLFISSWRIVQQHEKLYEHKSYRRVGPFLGKGLSRPKVNDDCPAPRPTQFWTNGKGFLGSEHLSGPTRISSSSMYFAAVRNGPILLGHSKLTRADQYLRTHIFIVKSLHCQLSTRIFSPVCFCCCCSEFFHYGLSKCVSPRVWNSRKSLDEQA